jgi:hypothetical protein
MTGSYRSEGVWRRRAALAARAFEAWWEGYAFDAGRARAEIAGGARAIDRPAADIPELIWGEGRSDPGDAAWTMRHARSLGLSARARVTVFGAADGAALCDLRAGARWTAAGYAREAREYPGGAVKSYDDAMTRIQRASEDGALIFFELHRDPDPGAFARFVGEFLKPNAPAAFVDFALPRAGLRVRDCFNEIAPGSPRGPADYQKAIKEAGFQIGEPSDETRAFLPLVARGWQRWRRAYDAALAIDGAVRRADALGFLSDYARLWAERFDGLKSGTLQVVRIPARKTG